MTFRYILTRESYLAEQGKFAYHGTDTKFDIFKRDFFNKGYGGTTWGMGFYFCDTREQGVRYAKYTIDRTRKGEPYLYTIDISGLRFLELYADEDGVDTEHRFSDDDKEKILSHLDATCTPQNIFPVYLPTGEYNENGYEKTALVEGDWSVVKPAYLKKMTMILNEFTPAEFFTRFLVDGMQPQRVSWEDGQKFAVSFMTDCGYNGVYVRDLGIINIFSESDIKIKSVEPIVSESSPK